MAGAAEKPSVMESAAEHEVAADVAGGVQCADERECGSETPSSTERDVKGLGFVADFVRMCAEGWRMGWHERNGGNASYRLRAEERVRLAALLAAGTASDGGEPVVAGAAESADLVSADTGSALLSDCCEPAPWTPLGLVAPGLAGEWLLVTATGSYFANVARCLERALGVVELSEAGDAYRTVWGFEGGGRPTSELAAHVLIHEVKKEASCGASRVLYHCHPAPVVALSHALPADARVFTRLLWKMMTECAMVFPEGLGMVGCEVPGSMELARKTADEARAHNAVVWARHGLLATGATCDEAFGLMHVVVKAAEIYREACVMAGGPDKVRLISDEELAALAAGLGVTLRPEYL